MNRREFLCVNSATLLGSFGAASGLLGQERQPAANSGIAWHRKESTRLFERVAWHGRPLLHEENAGVLDGFCRSCQDGELGPDALLTAHKPAIYLHYTILDEGSPLFEKMKDSVQVDAQGQPITFGWRGPDVIKKTWKMSPASAQWRDHLVQQARWVMELFNPDAIVLDETFTAWGIDHHPDRRGPLSPGGIELMRRLRATVRSFGSDKALFASDCSMGNFCLWGDGEAGDHCYDRLLGNPLYRQQPVRYLAALGEKAWLPCAWLFKSLWPLQMDLARKVGAGVSLTNGWGDNLGLARLPKRIRRQMIHDIESLPTR